MVYGFHWFSILPFVFQIDREHNFILFEGKKKEEKNISTRSCRHQIRIVQEMEEEGDDSDDDMCMSRLNFTFFLLHSL